MTWDELKDALIEAVMPATLAEVLLINVMIWGFFLISVGLGG